MAAFSPTEAEIKAKLREEVACLLSDKEDALGNRTVLRYWSGIEEAELDACRAFLRKYVSTINANAAATVANPLANGRILAGTFYGGEVAKEEEEDRDQTSARRFRLVQELILPKDESACGGTGATTRADSYRETAFETESAENRTAQTSAIYNAVGAFVAGAIVTIRNSLERSGLYRTQKLISTAKKQEWSWSYEIFEGTVTSYKGVNLTAAEYAARIAALALTTTTVNTVSVDLNQYGLIDYVVTVRPADSRISIGGGATKAYSMTWVDYQQHYKTVDGLELLQFERYEVGEIQTRSETTARNFIDGQGNTYCDPLGRWGFKAGYKTLKARGAFGTADTSIPSRPTP